MRLYRAVILFAAFTAAHIALALRFPLASDETYYWEWSRSLDWGYYDQGPVIAWLIRASSALFGSTEFGIRAGVVVCSMITLVLVYLIGSRLYGERAGTMAVVLAGVTPVGMAGGFIATYDVPLALFWTASLYAIVLATDPVRAAIAGEPPAARRMASLALWMGLGAVAGLGMLSKYTMALFLPCAVLYLGGRPTLRHLLRHPGPYIALIVAVTVTVPNIVWLAGHDWASFGHLAGLTEKGTGHSVVRRLGDYVGSQFGIMSPLLFLGMIAAMRDGLRRRTEPADHGSWFAFSFSVPVLIFFAMLTLKTKVQANWAICGWICASVGYAGWVWGPRGNQPRRVFAWCGVALALFASVMIGWPELRTVIGLRIPARLDQSRKMHGGRELGRACAREIEVMKSEGFAPIIGAATYDVASRMAFYTPGQPRAVCLFLGTRPNQYRYLNNASGARIGSNMLIADHRDPADPDRVPFESVFRRVVPVPEPVVVTVPSIYDVPVVTYRLYRCYGLTEVRVLGGWPKAKRWEAARATRGAVEKRQEWPRAQIPLARA